MVTMESRHIAAFREVLAQDAARATGQLRAALEAAEGPLIEETEDPRSLLVTFVWIGEAQTLSIRGTQLFADLMAPSHPMQRIAGSDVWYRSVVVPRGVTNTYQFVVDDPSLQVSTHDLAELTRLHAEATARAFADPFNPKRIYPLPALVAEQHDMPEHKWDSILALPNGEAGDWFVPSDNPRGSYRDHRFASHLLDNERLVSVYTPPGYVADGSPYPLLLLLDGEAWRAVAKLEIGLDNLIAAGEIQPPVVALIENPTAPGRAAARMSEMACNPTFAAMLADELWPFLRSNYNIAPTPAATIVGGASLGGLAAAHAAFEHPNVFGNVLSCSGAHWWGYAKEPGSPLSWGKDDEPEWLTRQFAEKPRMPIRFWIDVGQLETGVLLPFSPGVDHRAASRHLRTVLRAKGYDVNYFEAPGGHEFATFRNSTAKALQWLLKPRQPRGSD